MKIIQNDCIDCPRELGCFGSRCKYRNIVHYYCDNCEKETRLYYFDEQELCIDCIKELLEAVQD